MTLALLLLVLAFMSNTEARTYFRSADLDVPCRLKILNVEGKRLGGYELPMDPMKSTDTELNFFVTCQLVDSLAEPLCGCVQTRAHPSELEVKWDEWLDLPLSVSTLPLGATVLLTVWAPDAEGRPYACGGTHLILINPETRKLAKGKKKLFLWPNQSGSLCTVSNAARVHDSDRLDRLLKRYERGRMDHIDWLDNLSLAKVSERKVLELMKRSEDAVFLYVELPVFQHDVYFYEEVASLDMVIAMDAAMVPVHDPEQPNPVEAKRLNTRDPNAQPDRSERMKLATLIGRPTLYTATMDEKELLQTFSFWLQRTQPQALLPMLRHTVNWNDAIQVDAAENMLKQWKGFSASSWEPSASTAALELLGPRFLHPVARRYGVELVFRAPDHELALYLVALVQALRYEVSADNSPLARALVSRGRTNFLLLGNRLRWLLKVEADGEGAPAIFGKSYALLQREATAEQRAVWTRQDVWVERLTQLSSTVKTWKEYKKAKVTKLRRVLAEGDFADLQDIEPPMPLPLDPRLLITGVVPEEAHIFGSAMAPIRLTFKTVKHGNYMLIFKQGDDLRQDQFILSMISLMDHIIRHDGNADMKLTPYDVLATTRSTGILQCVPDSSSVEGVIRSSSSFEAHFQSNSELCDATQFRGVKSTIMDNFIRSCAGYCIITYLLGVGDRHLDNLMCQRGTGRLFHIDFGYVMDSDPKAFWGVSPMRIHKTMVDFMGGPGSQGYARFQALSCEAYNLLRRRAHLLLNLVEMVLDAGMDTIPGDEDAFERYTSKMAVGDDDEKASKTIVGLIELSVKHVMSGVIDVFHRIAQRF